MRTHRILPTMVVLVLAGAGSGLANLKPSPQTLAAFERIKALAGAWEGSFSGAEGAIKHARYEVVSNGTAVILMMDWGTTGNMATIFHLDGDSIIATHYCPVGNQPRMRATIAHDSKVIDFKFLDATNLSGPSEWHMRHLRITFDSPGRHTLSWTYVEGGKEETGVFRYSRSGN